MQGETKRVARVKKPQSKMFYFRSKKQNKYKKAKMVEFRYLNV